jgi:hypothetical protein
MSQTRRVVAILAADVAGTQFAAAGSWSSCAFN